MSDLAETVSTDLAPENSTTTGGGVPPATQPAESAESHRESLEAVMKDADKAAEKPAEKAPEKAEKQAEPDAKEQPKAEPKESAPVKQEAIAEKPETKSSESETHEKRPEPPARFSEAAKAVWRNVPREAQNEIARWQKETEESRPRLERYESIREFDELAKSNGRDLRESLLKINQFENMMKSNPVGALHAILQEIGPRKADGNPVSLLEVAQHVVNQGQEGYNQTIMQARQAQQQEALEAEQRQREQAHIDQNRELIRMAYVEPFRASHPRYDELQGYIAMVLNSDMVDKTLTPPERLEKAYEIAERINPASSQSPTSQARDLVEERRADADLSGSKSIKSSPGLVTDEDADERAKPGEDILESIQQAARKLIRA